MSLIFQTQMNNNYELLLGEDISEVLINNSKFELVNDSIYYSIFYENPIEYFNNSIFCFFSITKNDKIDELKIQLVDLIDEDFFNSLVNQYGKPDSILIIDKIIKISETIDDKTKAEFVKNEIKTKVGTFQEKPLYIIWDTEEFQIKILMKYKQRKTEITFIKK